MRGFTYEELEAEVEYLRSQLELIRSGGEIPRSKVQFGLTPKEAAVLAVLLDRAEAPRDAIYAGAFQYANGDGPTTKIIDVFICRLRQKFRALGAPGNIAAIWGVGYRLTPELRAWIADRDAPAELAVAA